REVPGDDHADDTERLTESHIYGAGDRDLTTGRAFRGSRVIREYVAHVARLPASVRDGVPGVAHFNLGELVVGGVDRIGKTPQQSRPVGGCHLAPGFLRP